MTKQQFNQQLTNLFRTLVASAEVLAQSNLDAMKADTERRLNAFSNLVSNKIKFEEEPKPEDGQSKVTTIPS